MEEIDEVFQNDASTRKSLDAAAKDSQSGASIVMFCTYSALGRWWMCHVLDQVHSLNIYKG